MGDLTSVIDSVLETSDEQVYRRIFQAFRIEVNHEYANLEQGLRGAVQTTKKGGIIAVITFHSGEDRIVKEFARKNRFKQTLIAPKKDFVAAYEKSAKLRILKI